MDTVQWLKKTRFHYHWSQFAHIYIELSDVLHITESTDRIVFDMEFALLPEHTDATPIAGERYTFRRGNITFSKIQSHRWRERDEDFFTPGQACSDKGVIMYLGQDSDGYLIYGDFGYLRVDCESIEVSIDKCIDNPGTNGELPLHLKA